MADAKDAAKANAAKKALGLVKDGMVVGLGSGSTANIFTRMLGESGLKVVCVSTSHDARAAALCAGLVVLGLDEIDRIDIAVDGADLVDPKKNLIKGMGGALAMEKVVDYMAGKFVCLVDESKLKKEFSGIVPVEALPLAAGPVALALQNGLGAKIALRAGSGKCGPVVTDNGNWIIDAEFGKVKDPALLEAEIQMIPGVVANGIFTRNKPVVIVGSAKGARVLG